jgi:creatinine amidohydrolase
MKRVLITACLVLGVAGAAIAQQPQAQGQGRGRGQQPPPDPRDAGGGRCATNPYNCVDTPNPLPAPNTVWMEEMTWMDVRDAVKGGKTTVIVSTGGIEPNGPWLALGKHNYVLRANCDAIARKLGNALCAPIVPFVPEGSIEPKSSHMLTVGTISLTEATFEALLSDIAHSYKMHGFENIVFIGDSGGNQEGMKTVAEMLNKEWTGNGVRIHFVPEYYSGTGYAEWLEKQGEKKEDIGTHAGITDTSQLMALDAKLIRKDKLADKGGFQGSGVSGNPARASVEYGKKGLELKIETAVKRVKEMMAASAAR